MSIITTYTFCKKVPQDLPIGLCRKIDKCEEKDRAVDDLRPYLPNLKLHITYENFEIQDSYRFYATSTGYELINTAMRNPGSGEPAILKHIQNIKRGFHTYGFSHEVRFFRTESNNYQQMVRGQKITSRKLGVKDTWKFDAFISTTVTNKPARPKCQEGKLTVFVFDFKTNEDIKGLFLEKIGVDGEEEFLLAPGAATITHVYKQNIGMGYMIKRVKFVVCNLQFF